MPESMKKHTKTQAEKYVVITPQNDLPTLKIPVEIDDVENSTLPSSLSPQRTIEVASAAVIVNNRITTPVTIQIRPKSGKSSIEIAQVHRNIFHAMKMIDSTLKIITFQTQKYRYFRPISHR